MSRCKESLKEEIFLVNQASDTLDNKKNNWNISFKSDLLIE